MRKPILIAGANGMLGTALQVVGGQRGYQVFAPDEDTFDVTSHDQVNDSIFAFAKTYPDGVVVNCAGYTNVDAAEEHSRDAFLVNQFGAGLLAETAAGLRLSFVQISSDCVFDGKKAGSYSESDEPEPLSVFGASKLAGEWAVTVADPRALIVRPGWGYGPGSDNFVTEILERAHRMKRVPVVSDEVGSPTYSMDLADALLRLIDLNATGLLHVSGSGWCSRDEFAREILRMGRVHKTDVISMTTAAFPKRAQRPANAVLDNSKAIGIGVFMPSWRDSLARYIATL